VLFPIAEIFSPLRASIVDIGAMDLGGEEDPFVRLSRRGLASIIGFEPLPEECAKLNAKADATRRYLPYAIADGSRRTLHVTNTGMTSSLLPPNGPLISLFMNLAELMQVVRTEQIDTRRLDDIPEIAQAGCDMIKADVQGLEFEIFSNAENVLSSCLLVQTEVEFVPLYENQPLFAEVDQVLRRNGFLFHKFLGLAGRPFRPLMMNRDPNAPISQVLWSDAVYVRDFTRLDGIEPAGLLKLAMLLHELYGSIDLCHRVLSAHDQKTGQSLAAKYMERLLRPPPAQEKWF
jgi:FkbM family methyltransferase